MSILKISGASDFVDALKKLPKPHADAIDEASARQNILTKPSGSLGRLEDIAIWVAGWRGEATPKLDNAACLVFAGNHGVALKGVSAFPPEVTAQMVENFKAGGAAINQLTDVAGASLDVVALDLDKTTCDFTVEPAMSEHECAIAIQSGIDAVPDDADIILLGEMGIGNTTAAAAVACAAFGGEASDWVGRGTGINDESLELKQKVVEEGCRLHKERHSSSFDILRTVGGRELAAIAGALIEARYKNIPVILDGFISTASAAVTLFDNTAALDHAIISHISVEQGHQKLIEMLGKKPLLDLGLRLGEASGAAVALMIVKAAIATHNGMATFGEAGVSVNE
mgnify:CR=1 FL=1